LFHPIPTFDFTPIPDEAFTSPSEGNHTRVGTRWSKKTTEALLNFFALMKALSQICFPEKSKEDPEKATNRQ
jgi:hypothetical protein